MSKLILQVNNDSSYAIAVARCVTWTWDGKQRLPSPAAAGPACSAGPGPAPAAASWSTAHYQPGEASVHQEVHAKRNLTPGTSHV